MTDLLTYWRERVARGAGSWRVEDGPPMAEAVQLCPGCTHRYHRRNRSGRHRP